MLQPVGRLLLRWALGPKPRFRRRNPSDYGLAFQDVAFSSRDGTPLQGWWVHHPESRGVVILCHGIFSSSQSLLGKARWLHHWGYSCLLFDFRSPCSLGMGETADVLGALDFVEERPETRRLPVGMLALSLGAASVVKALTHPSVVRGVCLEACFAHLSEAVYRRCQVLAGPFASRLYPWVCQELRRAYAIEVEQVSPLSEIHRLAAPLLLIHDALDWSLSRQTSQALFERAPQPKTFWIAPWSPHVGAARMAPQEYQRRVRDFFDRTLV